MKEIKILVQILDSDDKMGTRIEYNGIKDVELSLSQIHELVGILENLKQQQLSKVNNIYEKKYG